MKKSVAYQKKRCLSKKACSYSPPSLNIFQRNFAEITKIVGLPKIYPTIMKEKNARIQDFWSFFIKETIKKIFGQSHVGQYHTSFIEKNFFQKMLLFSKNIFGLPVFFLI